MVEMGDRWKLLIATILGMVAGMLIGFDAQDKQLEYAIAEDNATGERLGGLGSSGR